VNFFGFYPLSLHDSDEPPQHICLAYDGDASHTDIKKLATVTGEGAITQHVLLFPVRAICGARVRVSGSGW